MEHNLMELWLNKHIQGEFDFPFENLAEDELEEVEEESWWSSPEEEWGGEETEDDDWIPTCSRCKIILDKIYGSWLPHLGACNKLKEHELLILLGLPAPKIGAIKKFQGTKVEWTHDKKVKNGKVVSKRGKIKDYYGQKARQSAKRKYGRFNRPIPVKQITKTLNSFEKAKLYADAMKELSKNKNFSIQLDGEQATTFSLMN